MVVKVATFDDVETTITNLEKRWTSRTSITMAKIAAANFHQEEFSNKVFEGPIPEGDHEVEQW